MPSNRLSRRAVLASGAVLGASSVLPVVLAPATCAAAVADPVARPVGGTVLERGRRGEVLSLALSADDGDPCVVGVEAFGRSITFTARSLGRTAEGDRVVVRTSEATWDAARQGFVINEGTIGTVELHRVTWAPPAGEPAAAVTVTLASGPALEPWPIIKGWSGPDLQTQRAAGPTALASILAATEYLETLIGPGGGMDVVHPTWPGDPRPDPQGNADLAQLYTGLHRATGEPVHEERSRRTLDHLLSVQRDDGGFGFPWAFGVDTGHYDFPGHYPEDPAQQTHERGEPMAIITISTALAMLDAYDHFGEPVHLDSTGRIVDYLLHSERGLQWLDERHTRASIPYCTTAPIDEDGHTSAEIYNIDGSALSVISKYLRLRPNAEDTRMGDAVAANLLSKVEPDGSIVYGVANAGKPTGYGSAVARGLFDWGLFRGRRDLIDAGSKIIGWAMQTDKPFRLAIEPLVTPMGAIDNTAHVLFNINNRASSQRPDGSWTGGTSGRTDVGNPKHMVLLLNQMSYRTSHS